MDQLDFFKQQQTALDILRNFMFLKGKTVIEHDDFVDDAIFDDEPDLAMFRYKTKNKQIVSHENLDHNIKMHFFKCVYII